VNTIIALAPIDIVNLEFGLSENIYFCSHSKTKVFQTICSTGRKNEQNI